MKNILLIVGAFVISISARAQESTIESSVKVSEFCAPQAVKAAKNLARVNGAASTGNIADGGIKEGSDRGTFYVFLSDRIITDEMLNSTEGFDTYTVKVSGNHECTVYSVDGPKNPIRNP